MVNICDTLSENRALLTIIEFELVEIFTIVYGNIKIYCNKVETLCFLEMLGSVSMMHFTRYTLMTDFRSYLDFHKMRDVQGFHSVGHIYCWYA